VVRSIRSLILVFLVVGVVASAFAVIVSKYQSRLLFIEIEKQNVLLERYDIEWGQLQLELTTFTEENRVEQVATTQLKLLMPERNAIVYLKP
jgi:cell division protein FtsL